MSKRDRVLDAAIELLGTKGVRGLTHRGVDALAGMPAGSTSNYFRTRDALVAGVAGRLVERDRVDWAALARAPAPRTVAELLDGIVAFVRHSVGPDRTRTLARYALVLEAAISPAVRVPLQRARQDLLDWAMRLTAGLVPAPAVRLLFDYADALVLHQVAMPADDFDPRPALAALLDVPAEDLSSEPE